MRVIILAGGMGTRLREVVPDLPKPMAPVGGRPFLEYLIEKLLAAGLGDIVLSVGYRADLIREHFGHRWGAARISYSEETEALGTGGAIVHALRDGEADPLLVMNGDTFLDLDFRDLLAWRRREAPGPVAMVLHRVDDVSRYGAVQCHGGVVSGFSEKGPSGPGLINAGIYLIEPGVFSRFGLSGKFSLETELLRPHVATLRPRAYVSDAYFVDIGVPSDFARAQIEIPPRANRPP
jgi:D-glycero-alpha-D-manno-heptose 1-phosphate guanylyltransferase